MAVLFFVFFFFQQAILSQNRPREVSRLKTYLSGTETASVCEDCWLTIGVFFTLVLLTGLELSAEWNTATPCLTYPLILNSSLIHLISTGIHFSLHWMEWIQVFTSHQVNMFKHTPIYNLWFSLLAGLYSIKPLLLRSSTSMNSWLNQTLGSPLILSTQTHTA